MYDFGNGLNITSRQLARQIQYLGPVELSVDEGNETGFHLRRATITTGTHKQQKIFFQILSIKDLNPLLPIEARVWEELDTVVERMTLSFQERSCYQLFGKVDTNISNLCKKLPATVTPTDTSNIQPCDLLFWQSNDARKLFCPQGKETTKNCIIRRISVLKKVISTWDFKPVLIKETDDREYDSNELTDTSKRYIINKCMYLVSAYKHALEYKDKGWTWEKCCKAAVEKLSMAGIDMCKWPKTVQDINRAF